MRTLPKLLPHRTDGVAHDPASGTTSRGVPAPLARHTAADGGTTGTVRAWGGRANVRVDDPAALAPTLRLARHHLRAVARSCDRQSPSAHVHRLAAADGKPLPAGPLLLRAVRAALETAADTHGLVDPTTPILRATAEGPGPLPVCGRPAQPHQARGWPCVEVTDRGVRVPGGTVLDLNATALPLALDDLALVVAQLTGTGVRVALHGRLAGCVADGRRYGVAVTDGRRVVDPRTGRTAESRWSRVEMVAGSARSATALALAAVLHGDDAPRWLAERMEGERLAGALAGRAARLVAVDGETVLVGDLAVLSSRLLDDGLLEPASAMSSRVA